MSRVYKTAKCLKKQPEFSPLDKSRNVFIATLTFLIIIFMGASIFYISTHVKVVGIGYKINQELALKQQLIEDNKRLSLKIARLRSPTHIERTATEILGLRRPGPGQIVNLSALDDPATIKLIAKLNPKAISPKSNQSSTAVENSKKVSEKIRTPKKSATPKVTQQARIKKSNVPIKVESGSKDKKFIIAKIVPAKISSRDMKTQYTNHQKKSRRGKEAVPAVMIDPLP